MSTKNTVKHSRSEELTGQDMDHQLMFDCELIQPNEKEQDMDQHQHHSMFDCNVFQKCRFGEFGHHDSCGEGSGNTNKADNQKPVKLVHYQESYIKDDVHKECHVHFPEKSEEECVIIDGETIHEPPQIEDHELSSSPKPILKHRVHGVVLMHE